MKRTSGSSIAAFIVLTAALFSTHLIVQAESSGIQVILSVPGCNNNAICESGAGETALNCPIDCSATPTPPASTPGSGSGSGGTGYEYFTLDTMLIHSEPYQVQVTWTTHLPTNSSVVWGRTTEYELGSLSESAYFKDHAVNIENLVPNTKYYFMITARSAAGRVVEYANWFVSAPLPGESLPNNVAHFYAYPYQDGIALEWKNPSDLSFAGVRIVRSPFNYPRDPQEGMVVYEAVGEYALDRAVKKNVLYYYSLFVRNKAGTYSSGALASAKVTEEKSPLDSDTGIPFPTGTGTTTAYELSLYDFDFIQDGRKISFFGDEITMDRNLPLIVSLEAERAEGAKQLIFVLNLPAGQSKYQFQKNKIGEWITTVPPGSVGTTSAFSISIESPSKKKTIAGFLVPYGRVGRTTSGYRSFLWLLLLLILLIILFLLFILWRRKKDEEQKADPTR